MEKLAKPIVFTTIVTAAAIITILGVGFNYRQANISISTGDVGIVRWTSEREADNTGNVGIAQWTTRR